MQVTVGELGELTVTGDWQEQRLTASANALEATIRLDAADPEARLGLDHILVIPAP